MIFTLESGLSASKIQRDPTFEIKRRKLQTQAKQLQSFFTLGGTEKSSTNTGQVKSCVQSTSVEVGLAS